MIVTGEEHDMNRKGTEEEQKRNKRGTKEDKETNRRESRGNRIRTSQERGRYESMRGTGEEQRNLTAT